MIDLEQAGEAVLALKALHFFKTLDSDAIGDLARAFTRARDVGHAMAAAEMLKEQLVDVPAPAQIAQALAAIPEPEAPRRDRSCRVCRGTGYATAWHILVEDNRTRQRTTRRVMCHSCSVEGNGCQYRVVPNDKGADIAGLFYCEARVRQMRWPIDMGTATGIGPIDSAHPCGHCEYGANRALAYASREAEQSARKEKRT